MMAALGDRNEGREGAKMAAELAKTPGRDHVRLTVTPIPRGARYRLEIEEGVLKVLALYLYGTTGSSGPSDL